MIQNGQQINSSDRLLEKNTSNIEGSYSGSLKNIGNLSNHSPF